jgi:hypothetical protein
MRRKVGCLCLAGFVVLLAIGEIPVDAGIRPSFSLDGGLWNAAHIESVQTTPADGVLSVVESSKGDLKAGDSLETSELKPTRMQSRYRVFQNHRDWVLRTRGFNEQIPRQPAGSTSDFVFEEKRGKWRSLLTSGWLYQKALSYKKVPSRRFSSNESSSVWSPCGL